MKTKDTTLTPQSKIVEMTKALPQIPNGARPVNYDQTIPGRSVTTDDGYGKPDPAHDE